MMDYTQSASDMESGERLSRAGAEEPVMNQEQSDAVATMDAPKTVDGKRERDARFAQLTSQDI